MHITEWEASRSGAGITVAMTDAGGVKRKQFVKKIKSDGGSTVAIGGDGARFVLGHGRDTSAEVAAIAGELINLESLDFAGVDEAREFRMKVRKLAASALGQHQ